MTRSAPARGLATATVAAGVTWASGRRRPRHPGGQPDRWARSNHAGHPVTLREGPEYVVGAAAASLVAGSPAGALAVLAAGGFGALDDLAGDGSTKGLRGHLRALRGGQLTTGAVKVAGLAATGVVAAALTAGRHRPGGARGNRLAHLLLGGGVVAGTANLVNLLDLRPGRALKATLAICLPLALAGSASAPAAMGAAVAVLPDDLRAVSMLGDTGANAAGALVGVALIERLSLRRRLWTLTGLAALTLVSERVSFTSVIESTPVLRELDAWGRRTETGAGRQ